MIDLRRPFLRTYTQPQKVVPLEPAVPAFDDHAFSEWASHEGEIRDVSLRRIAALAEEYAEVTGCQARSTKVWTRSDSGGLWVSSTVPVDDTIGFDAISFTRWMAAVGPTTGVNHPTMLDHLTWHAYVIQRCAPPSDTVRRRMLESAGWQQYRGKGRIVAGKNDRPTLYKLVVREQLRIAA